MILCTPGAHHCHNLMKHYRAKPSAQLPKHMHNISSDNRSSLQIKAVKAMVITYAHCSLDLE